ncbi:MAG: hypothetical protein ACTSWV_00185 [Candidatus Asgardarchaeia archaeon]
MSLSILTYWTKDIRTKLGAVLVAIFTLADYVITLNALSNLENVERNILVEFFISSGMLVEWFIFSISINLIGILVLGYLLLESIEKPDDWEHLSRLYSFVIGFKFAVNVYHIFPETITTLASGVIGYKLFKKSLSYRGYYTYRRLKVKMELMSIEMRKRMKFLRLEKVSKWMRETWLKIFGKTINKNPFTFAKKRKWAIFYMAMFFLSLYISVNAISIATSITGVFNIELGRRGLGMVTPEQASAFLLSFAIIICGMCLVTYSLFKFYQSIVPEEK